MTSRKLLHTAVRLLLLSLVLLRPLPVSAQDTPSNGESFTIQMPDYFVELQGGQRLDLEIHYRYAPGITRPDIPDYRAVQILVEDTLYGMPDTSPYWEITNQEIVLRLLTAFPQFTEITSQLSVQPRGLLNITRSSTVTYSQHDHPRRPLLVPLDQDTYYQARDGHYNILIPRPLKASLTDLIARLRASADNTADPHGVLLDLTPFPLRGSTFTFPALLTSLKPFGPYDALALPEKVGLNPALHLTKIADLGPLRGLVKITCPTPDLWDKTGKPVAEESLADLLGLDPALVLHLPLADAREKFFTQRAPYIVMEEKVARPYRLRGVPIEPYAPETKLALFAKTPSGKTPLPVPAILLKP